MDILKLFSALSNLFDTPPKIEQPPKKEEQVKPKNNKACSFMSTHEQLSKRIKQQNKKG